ncbi:MAG: ABC transporter permease [Candidatus Hodarchaeota archaeon]
MGLFRTIKAQWVRWVKTDFFRPGIFFWNSILPLAWGLQFYFYYLPFEFDSIELEFEGPGVVGVDLVSFTLTGQICWMLFINTSLFGGAFFMRERWEGTLEVLFLSPASRPGIIAGTAFAGATNFLWFALGLGFILLLVDIQLQIESWLTVVIALLVAFLTLLALGMFFESFFIASRLGGMWATSIQEPLQFSSGLIFPIQYLPKALRGLAVAIPFTYVLLIARGAFLGGLTIQDVLWEFIILIVMIFLLFLLSVLFLAKVEAHVKKQANLNMF